jgi:hypothetical protein
MVANQATITANKNPALTNRLRQDLPELQRQLVNALFSRGAITPANVISACTFGGGDTNSY